MTELLFSTILGLGLITFIILVFWHLFWTGWALWIAARKNSKSWFLIFLIVNTFGLLEIIYIFYWSKRDTLKNLDRKLDELVGRIKKSVSQKQATKDEAENSDDTAKTETEVSEN